MLSGCASPFRTVIVLSQSDLQENAERSFPIEERVLIAKLRLEEPRVLLDDGADRIGFELTARVSLGPLTYLGHVGVDGKLRYRIFGT